MCEREEISLAIYGYVQKLFEQQICFYSTRIKTPMHEKAAKS